MRHAQTQYPEERKPAQATTQMKTMHTLVLQVLVVRVTVTTFPKKRKQQALDFIDLL